MPAPQKPSAADLLSGRVAQIPLDTDIQAPAPVVSNAEQVLGAMPTVQEMSGAQATAGLRDVAGRAAASMLGTPVDLAAMAMAPLGYQHPAPVLGSEWIGQKMQDAGMVSPERRPAAELLADLAAPAGLPKAAASSLAMLAAMSPEGKASVRAAALAEKSGEQFRMGDVTVGQQNKSHKLGLPLTETRDVVMPPDVMDHIIKRRMQSEENFSAEDVVKFLEQAMSKGSRVEMSKGNKNPQLENNGLTDLQTGQRYNAQMPLQVTEDGFLAPRTVIPDGLSGRNKKPPEKPEG